MQCPRSFTENWKFKYTCLNFSNMCFDLSNFYKGFIFFSRNENVVICNWQMLI